MLDILTDGAQQYGVRLTEAQIAQFQRYLDLLQAWMPRANLVGSAESETVQRRHFLESIALGAALREREILRPDVDVLDIGAGAGFPGVVFKICWPSIRLTLLEATAKKTAFLQELVTMLGFDETPVLTGRAETLAHDATLRERFGLVVARAVAPLPVLLELGMPFARVGGRLVTPKGSRAAEEVAAASGALATLAGRAFLVPFAVPGPPQSIVAVVKQRPTLAMYPRRPGMPAKSPL